MISLLAMGQAAYPRDPQGAAPEEPEAAEVKPIGPLTHTQDAAVKDYVKTSKARHAAQAKAFDKLQKKLNAAIAELKQDKKRRYLEIEDILLDAAAYADQDIATVGRSFYCRYEGYVDLANAVSEVPVRVSALPKAEKAKIESLVLAEAGFEPDWSPHHVLIVRGRLKGSAEQGYHIEASGFSDLGLAPEFGDIPMNDLTLSQLRSGRDTVYGDNILARREKLMAVIQELEADPRYQYVDIEDLIINRDKYSGQEIATLGLPHWERGYVRTPYFDLMASYSATNHIPVLMAQLPLESRKELLRNQHPSHLVVIKGQVAAAAGNYYIAASSYTDVFQDSESPADILKPNLEPLAPFDGDVKKFRKQASFGMVTEEELRRGMDEYRDKLLAAIAALRKDPKSTYAEIEDIGLDPGSYLDRDIVTMGVPGMVDAVGTMPHFELANKSFGEISIPVLMSGFSPEMKKEIVREASKNVVIVRGRFKRSLDQRYYIEASGYSDLGPPPSSSGSTQLYISEMLKGADAYNPHRANPAMEKKLQDAVAELKRDDSCRYVEFQDLLRSPGVLAGRDIATIGVPSLGVAKLGSPSFYLYEKWDTPDPIPVLMTRLPLQTQKGLFRIMHENMIVIKGRLLSSGQKYYLEAADYIDLGPYPMSPRRKK